jgi:hypothetical protein
MKWLCMFVAVAASVQVVNAEDATPSRIDSITKIGERHDACNARDAIVDAALDARPFNAGFF